MCLIFPVSPRTDLLYKATSGATPVGVGLPDLARRAGQGILLP